MPAARYFRGLTTFDLLGNLVPGTVVLAAALASLPNPPTPTRPGGYLLFGVVAFSIGHFVQRYASAATGDRRSFDWTMDAARQQGRSPDADDEGENADESGDPGSARNPVCEKLSFGASALFDPLVWPVRSPRGTVLEERIIANLAWKHLLDSYDLPPGTDNHSVLFHLVSSELDDVATPSRALRFQAIRNFHRGMWTATWITLALWSVVVSVDALVESGVPVLGAEYQQGLLLDFWSPGWHLVAVLAVLGFRYLAEVYEEEFIEHLFTDFVVATGDQSDGEAGGNPVD